MNTYYNKRRQKTVERIQAVFLEELKTRELEEIKVSDICKKAEINRSTFYANFLDTRDLADTMRQYLTKEVNSLFEQDINWEKSEEEYLKLFQHIRENQSLYNCYFKLSEDPKSELKLHEAYLQNYKVTMSHMEYRILFFKSGLNAIIQKWLADGCKESPEEMQSILLYEYRRRFEQPENL